MSIRLRSGGLSFSLCDPAVGGGFFLQEVEFDRAASFVSSLKEFFFANECLSWSYRQTQVIGVSPEYALVPLDFCVPGETRKGLGFCYSSPIPFCLSERWEEENAELLYGADEESYAFCSRSLERPLFSHYTTLLLRLWRKQSEGDNLSRRRMCVNLERKRIDVACLDGMRLLFLNSFRVDQPDDILYYILYVWKQVGLDPEHDRLALWGEPMAREPLLVRLRRYLRHAEAMEIPSEVYLLGADVAKAPLDLISFLCE